MAIPGFISDEEMAAMEQGQMPLSRGKVSLEFPGISNPTQESQQPSVGFISDEQMAQMEAQVSEPETIQQKAAGVLGSVGQGVTFGLADEAAAGVRAGISGAQRFLGFQPSYQDYESELEALRGGQKQFAEKHPVVDTVGEIAGSLMIPVGGAMKGATLTQKLWNAAKLAAGMGAAYGFGKAELNRPETRARLAAVLEAKMAND